MKKHFISSHSPFILCYNVLCDGGVIGIINEDGHGFELYIGLAED